MTDALEPLGWDPGWAAAFEQHGAGAGRVPARVAVQHRGGWQVLTDPERMVLADGSAAVLRRPQAEQPVVGDWVAVDPQPPAGGRPAIHAVLPRRTRFSRLRPGRGEAEEQVVAANVDLALCVTAVGDLNPRRLERYLTLAWESGAEPAVVVTKADLASDVAADLRAVDAVALDVPIFVTSVRTGEGLDALAALCAPGRTAALLGSSGAGKSSLVNALAGSERQAVAEVRTDGRGRHTTTHRELLLLPGGALLIDTPGMREVGMWHAGAEGLEVAFADVAELAEGCRFRDCSHDHEPGCAVRSAVAEGQLDPERLGSWRKLQLELQAADERKRPPKGR